ncbi:MAG TPA: HEAT repeat domain-containing protein [Thermoanaerobaculia bacterium]|jgi:HEAT repeat protein|nr:HEAT repeat domain-containing protein [Thermoanaerobaculia bacterium]
MSDHDIPQDVPPEEDLPAEPSEEEEPAGSGALRSFLGLFVVPLLVVILCVAIFIGFGWIAYDRQSTRDYLNDLESGWKPRRVQAAYELSKILVSDPQALEKEQGAKGQVRRLFQEADDPEMKRYLALVMGRTGDREALPLLVEALNGEDERTRIYALWSLGMLGDPQAREPLAAALGDKDPGIRKIAAFALGELDDRSVVPSLRPLLDDAATDVRWNAALSLARLGSAEGVPVLESMLDRRLLAQVPDITREQQEEAMLSAIRALAALRDPRHRALFDRLAKDDPSLKVRQAAIEAGKVASGR